MDENLPKESLELERWTLIRDTAVLQFKLIVDGLRDFLLVPLSLIAAIASLATSKDGVPGPHFYRLLHVGKQSEMWINLFGAYKHAPEEITHDDRFADMNIDELVVKVESFVVDEYKSGGITAQAKAKIDQALNAIQRRGQKRE
jgi:hypothetical protein